MKRVIYIFGILLLVSCTKEIEIRNNKFKEKLVVNGHFSPNNEIELKLSKSQRITGQLDSSYLSNAAITLLEDGINIGTFSYKGKSVYVHNQKPDPGKAYTILVQEGLLKSQASDSLPSSCKILNIDTSTIIGVKGSGYLNLKIKLEGEPNRTINNEINVKLKLKRYIRNNGVIVDSVFQNRKANLLSSHFLISSNPNNTNYEFQFMFQTNSANGISQVEIGTYDLLSLRKDEILLGVTVSCISHSFSGYAYYNSYYNHLFYRNNPFALPVNVVGNILNGYGVFSGMVKHDYTITY